MMQYDSALCNDCPKPADKDGVATPQEKADIEKWQHYDRMCLMVMKSAIQETLQCFLPDQESSAKEYLKALEEQFTKSKKAEVGTLLCKLTSTNYKSKVGVREHFTEMIKLQRALKEHGNDFSYELLIDYIFMSLPPSYSQFRLTYNCNKEIWTLTKFEAQLVQEEERQKINKEEEAHIAATDSKEKKKEKTQE
jgi:gag-polypeptide of LTR copia-type